jgi:N-succinyldiaminopimelate aminotransferase
MNPLLSRLQPYPFERLRALYKSVTPNGALRPIVLHVGEPKHPTPKLLLDALARGATTGLANYPMTIGTPALRQAIAGWLARRHGIDPLDPATQVIPVAGSREGLFSFAQAIVDGSRHGATVVVPNPFYQIYEGAALLAGAQTYCVNADPARGFLHEWDAVPDDVWRRTQLVYVCSPDNPTGSVIDLALWKRLFELSDRHGFVIASDECYSEIYFDEARAPLGALAAAKALGRASYPRLVVFGSLSKRSNAPGLRSGFAAGDAALIDAFRSYRTYHGTALSDAVATASIAAWNDEAHVRENRAAYAAKFAALQPMLDAVMPAPMPQAAFYLWAQTPVDDAEFAKGLYEHQNVTVLPGSYLGRDAHGRNPGRNRIRVALVAAQEECTEAVARIVDFARTL